MARSVNAKSKSLIDRMPDHKVLTEPDHSPGWSWLRVRLQPFNSHLTQRWLPCQWIYIVTPRSSGPSSRMALVISPPLNLRTSQTGLGNIKDVMLHYWETNIHCMKNENITKSQSVQRHVTTNGLVALPAVVVAAGEDASRRFIEFFTANIRNANTRAAYARAVGRFCLWCEEHHLELRALSPTAIAAYIEQLGNELSKPTVKQHLAAIRMLLDWLVIGQIVPNNPASAVRGPKYVAKKGKTPVLTADETRILLDSIDTRKISGLRDRALIAVMVYGFARVSAVVGMNTEDYFQQGKRWWFRLHEKGGKRHEVPAHHNAEAYIDAYLAAAQIADQKKSPLFRTIGRRRDLTERRVHRVDAFRMVKRRCRAAGVPETTCCHSFRATGITTYLENGGTIEHAQQIAAHESPRTTKLYDRTADVITLDEIEKVVI